MTPATAVSVQSEPLEVMVERGRLRMFAAAIGETDPIYSDVDAARAAGHPDLPVPPTFLFGLELDRPDPFDWLTAIGIDLRRVLHGEQRFDYHRLCYAGDKLRLNSEVTDITGAKGGRLTLVTRQTTVTRVDQPIATLQSVIVVRNEQVLS